LLKFGSPELNKQMVYLTRREASDFFAAENLATTVALKLDGKGDVPAVLEALHAELDTAQYEIMAWQEMIPDLVEAKELDAAGNNLVLIVLYLIISFGVFGTILMMTKERQYEFGVLIGIGMRRLKLGLTVWLEIVFMGLLGVLAGIALSFPLVYYFQENPIDLSVMGEEAIATYEKFGMEPILPAVVATGHLFPAGADRLSHHDGAGHLSVPKTAQAGTGQCHAQRVENARFCVSTGHSFVNPEP
jgi:putative ABC transport system permease protein